MPLNDPLLIQDLEDLYDYMATVKDPAIGKREYARRQAALIGRYVRSALVTTTGTAATQTGRLT